MCQCQREAIIRLLRRHFDTSKSSLIRACYYELEPFNLTIYKKGEIVRKCKNFDELLKSEVEDPLVKIEEDFRCGCFREGVLRLASVSQSLWKASVNPYLNDFGKEAVPLLNSMGREKEAILLSLAYKGDLPVAFFPSTQARNEIITSLKSLICRGGDCLKELLDVLKEIYLSAPNVLESISKFLEINFEEVSEKIDLTSQNFPRSDEIREIVKTLGLRVDWL